MSGKKVPMFVVGDRVRVTRDYLPSKLGTEFVVTGVKQGYEDWATPESGNFYCTGDPLGNGVWEKFLERVTS